MTADSGSTLAAVEIVTEGYSITGDCRGLGEHLRLVDLLNNPEITHLQLADIKIRRLIGNVEIMTGKGPIFIGKDSVILGRSLASAEEEARRNEVHRFDFVQKDKQLMIVFVPPFRVQGNVHMIKEADFSVALPKLFEGFLAMTEVSTIHEGQGDLKWDDQFVVVNGQKMEMVCLLTQPSSEKVAVDAPPADDDLWEIAGLVA